MNFYMVTFRAVRLIWVNAEDHDAALGEAWEQLFKLESQAPDPKWAVSGIELLPPARSLT